MKKVTTAERLKEIMERKKLRQVDILERAQPYFKKYNTKLSKQDLSQYISGKVEPGQRKLSVLAAALEVNEAWLMGIEMDESPYSQTFDDKSSNDEVEVIELYRSLNSDGKKDALKYLKLLQLNPDYKKPSESRMYIVAESRDNRSSEIRNLTDDELKRIKAGTPVTSDDDL